MIPLALGSTIGPMAGGPALLDGRVDVAVAYSLRRIRNAYTGPLVKVRRSSDSTEQDFATGTAAVAWADVLAFIGAGTGFVSKLYDQSGNARDLAQSTASAQPAIGLLSNSKPGLTFDGISHFLRTAAFALAQPISFNICYRWVADPANLDRYVFDGLTLAEVILYEASTAGLNRMYAGLAAPSSDIGTSMPVATRGLVAGAFNGASSKLEVNAATVASFTGSSGAQGLTGLSLGTRGDSAAFANIDVQEFVLFSTAHSQAVLQADNAAIRAAWGF